MRPMRVPCLPPGRAGITPSRRRHARLLRRQGHARRRLLLVRVLPPRPRSYAKHPQAASAAVLAEDPAREPAPHRGRRRRPRRGHRGARHGRRRRRSPRREIAFTPARVLLQDFTGVPAVVDLAAMRDAMKTLGRRPEEDQPAAAGRAGHRPLGAGRRLRLGRRASRSTRSSSSSATSERYQFLKWGQRAFRNFRVVPPDTGIVPPGEPRVPGARVVDEERGRQDASTPTRWSAPTRTPR